jgi:hypothetical protein
MPDGLKDDSSDMKLEPIEETSSIKTSSDVDREKKWDDIRNSPTVRNHTSTTPTSLEQKREETRDDIVKWLLMLATVSILFVGGGTVAASLNPDVDKGFIQSQTNAVLIGVSSWVSAALGFYFGRQQK